MANEAHIHRAPESGQRLRALSPDDVAALLQVSHALQAHREGAALFAALAKASTAALATDALLVQVPGWQDASVDFLAAGAAVQRWERDAASGTSLLESVASRGEPAVFDSLEPLGGIDPGTHGMLAAAGMRSLAVLPLHAHGDCLGAMGFASREAGAFGASRLRLLEEISNAVAIAVDRCRGFEDLERSQREHAALVEMNRAIGRHLHRDDLFGALAGCLRNIVPTERFGIELPIEGDRLQGHLLTPQASHAQPTQPTILPARGTACDWVLRHREWVVTASREELRERFPITFDIMERDGMESLCTLPLVTGERCRGVLFFMATEVGAYARLRRNLLEHVASAVAAALDDCLAHEEVRQLRDRLAAENVYLQEEIRSEHDFSEVVGNSPALLEVLRAIEQVAPTDTTVLILGETGTGKEVLARAIHDRSARRERPLVKVNCGAITAGLVESELFGHVKGSFTGALQDREGRFQLADGGTIFLDEVGELPLETQVKLLRVLQEHEFEPIGSSATRKVDVRVIAATNRDLGAAQREGRFRSDLFYRLNVFPLQMPPLRERSGDLPLLVAFFVRRYAQKLGKPVKRVSDDTMRRFEAYAWPGNVRELQNVIERAVVLSTGPVLVVDERVLPAAEERPAPRGVRAAATLNEDVSLEEFERRHILGVLEQTQWRIEGERGAARLLELQPSTLRSRMRKLGIARPPA